ncbi:MAG: carboxypeptidase regulatory-like domain-containing protein [Planctomyces sp.]|nr:carboxypeptidase regulatory-like domain-containing protein [Planctomyces sp.]
MLRTSIALMSLAMVVLISGCGGDGPPLHSVKGKVTKAGAPLEGVMVTMVAAEGGYPPVSGRTGSDGSFNIMSATGRLGAPEGTYKVYISPKSSNANPTGNPNGGPPSNMEDIMKQYGGGAKGGRSSAAPGSGPASGDVIPVDFQAADKTPLRQTVPISGDWVIEIP